MTPTTPSGWYSSVAAWLMATRPLRTRRGRSTRRACRAAQSMCTIASRISSWASASGLPVSVCTSSARRPIYRVICDFQASSRACRSFQDRPAHQDAAWCACSTTAATSSAPNSGKVAITSDVAGLSVSKVSPGRAGPVVRSVETMVVHHRSVRRKFVPD